jgi:diguanylate cyclase (GGDEF)-like protein
MPQPILVYTALRIVVAVLAMVAAGLTFAYAMRTTISRERRLLGLAGGLLLTTAAALSSHDAVTREDISPISWAWLLTFDLVVPLWTVFLLRGWGARDRAEQDLTRLATTDALTGLLNRRGFVEQATAVLARALRSEAAAAVIMLDLDRFKAINDRYGHPAGDTVLRDFAAVLRHGLRIGDVLGRLGGEEFAFLMPDSNADYATATAERLRTRVRNEVAHPAGPPFCITVSAGVAGIEMGEEAGTCLAAALAAADAALNRAKQAGRDQVVRATEIAASPGQHTDAPQAPP